jgi:hypothetical protein
MVNRYLHLIIIVGLVTESYSPLQSTSIIKGFRLFYSALDPFLEHHRATKLSPCEPFSTPNESHQLAVVTWMGRSVGGWCRAIRCVGGFVPLCMRSRCLFSLG